MASLKEALLTQSPSLELQRAASDEIARLRFELEEMQRLISFHRSSDVRFSSRAIIEMISCRIKEALK